MFTSCSELQAPSLKILGFLHSSHGADSWQKALFDWKNDLCLSVDTVLKKSHQASSSMFFLCSVFVCMCGAGGPAGVVGEARIASFPNQLSKTIERQFHLHWSPFLNNLKLLEQSWKTRNSLLSSPRINHNFPTHYVCILLVTIWTHSTHSWLTQNSNTSGPKLPTE